jgi:tetratricopeptide (TPR) repeat protein
MDGWVRNYKWPADESRCYRVLGDLDADDSQHASVRQHYDEALRIARGISHRPSLIEALLARGRWTAKQGQAGPARSDLDEALGYALEGGYRIYEADLRVALAWVHLAAGNPAAARAEASRAQRLSESMGYYWGKVDAEEVLGEIEA